MRQALRVHATVVRTVVLALLLAVGLGTVPQAAQATTSPFFPLTSFAIDGNIAGPNDWGDPLGSALYGPYTTSQGFPSSGIISSSFGADSCSGDATGFPGSQTPDTNPWVPGAANVNNKDDLCSGGSAIEVVNVNGQYQYVLYSYWARSATATGDMSAFTLLQGPVAGRGDDKLVSFDYNSAGGGSVTVTVYTWNGTGWVPAGTLPTTQFQSAIGPNVSPATGGSPGANGETFGEFAVNLTTSGILSDNTCQTFSAASTISKTGNSMNAQLIDSLSFNSPVSMNSCGQLTIVKATSPAGSTAGPFAYSITEADGHAVYDATLVQPPGEPTEIGDGTPGLITGSLTVPTNTTDVWGNVFASPDYVLQETSMPAGWLAKQLVCTYYDPFTRSTVTRTYTGATASTFQVPSYTLSPGGTTCTITNETSYLRIAKTGAGDPAAAFNFTVTGQPAGIPLSLGQTTTPLIYTPGSSVSITEALPSTGIPWTSQGVVCRNSAGTVVASSASPSISVTTVGGDTITCTYTNQQQAALYLRKDIRPDDPTRAFDFTGSFFPGTVSLNDFRRTDGTLTGVGVYGPVYVTPNQTYTATEATAPDLPLSTIFCLDPTDNSTFDLATATATYNPAPGETVTCSFINTAPGSITIVKRAVPSSLQNFAFTATGTGVPSSFTLDDDLGTGGGIGGDNTYLSNTTFSGLNEGTYSFTEGTVPGWTLSNLNCAGASVAPVYAGSTVTVTLSTQESITCSYTNTRASATLTLRKQWVGSTAGDQATLVADALEQPTYATATSTAPGGDALDTTNVVTIPIYSGDSIALSETVADGLGDNYATTLDCGGVSIPLTDLRGTYAVPTVPANVTCTFVNTDVRPKLTLVKQLPNTAGGTVTLANFPLTAANQAEPVAITGTSGTAAVTAVKLPAGSYTLSEPLVTGYTPTTWTCTNSTTGTSWSFDGGAAGSGTGAVTLTNTDVVTCAITNEAQPSQVSVTKIITGSTVTPWAFPFTLTPLPAGQPASQSATDTTPTVTWTGLVPGNSYTISEGAVPGYDQGAMSCTGITDTDGDATNASVTFIAPLNSLADSAEVVCTISNPAQTSQVSVTKTVTGSTVTPWSFPFTLSPAPTGQTATQNATNATPTVTWTGLVPGSTYTVGEGTVPGYDQGTMTCTGVVDIDTDPTMVTFVAPLNTLAEAPEVVCSISNPAQTSQVSVTKTVTGSTITPWSFDVAISPTPTGATSPATVTDTTPTITWAGLIPGTTYTINETPQAGYDPAVMSCTGITDTDTNPATVTFTAPLNTLAEAPEVVCSISNPAQTSQVSVTKTVTGSTITPWSFDVAISPTPTGATSPATVTNTTPTITWAGLIPGTTYTINETPQAGYDPAVMSCTGITDTDTNPATVTFTAPLNTLVDAPEVTCTISNPAQTSQVSVTKTVTGSTITPWSFDVAISPTPTGATSPATVTDTTPTITWAGLIPGTTYTINETPQAGYDPAVMSCTGITDTDTNPATVTFTAPLNTLAEAPEVVCSISNPAQTSQVSVTKTVTGVDASLAWSFPFTLTPTPTGQPASQDATGTGPTTATPITWTGLIPGTTYTINEGTVPGYDQGALTCTGITDTDGNTTNASVTFTAPLNTLADAPEVVCSISNPAQTSQVSVTKTVTGVDASLAWSFPFTLTPTPTGQPASQNATGTGPTTATPITWTGLIPGTTYTINEGTVPGYDQGALTCTGITDTDGNTTNASVTFTAPLNTAVDAPEVVCSISNPAQTSQVSVTKTVTGVDASLAWSFPFTLTPTPTGQPASQNATGTGPTTATPITWTGLIPGTTYTINEGTVPGYDQGALTCTGITDTDGNTTNASVTFTAPLNTLAEAPEVVCSISNPAQTSQVSVTKTVTGSTITPWSFDVAISPTPTGATSPATVTDTTPTITWAGLIPGTTYTINETPQAGYDPAVMSCTGITDTDTNPATVTFTAPLNTLAEAPEVVCSISNPAQTSQVSVTKTVTGSTITPWSFDVAISPTPTGATSPATVTDTTPTITWAGLIPGTTYTINETPQAGYDPAVMSCTGITDTDTNPATVTFTAPLNTLAEAPEVVCSISNPAQTSQVSVTKTVTGSTITPWSFDVAISPTPTGATSPATVTDTTPTITWAGLIPGTTYTINETPQAGYDPAVMSCTGITDTDTNPATVTFTAPLNTAVDAPEVVCSISNPAQTSQVSVTKTVTGVDASLAWSFPFTLTPTPTGQPASQNATGTGPTTATPITWTGLIPGTTYTINEGTVPGYDQGALTCTGITDTDGNTTNASVTFTAPLNTLAEAPEVVCSISNPAQTSQVSVTKTVTGSTITPWSFDVAISPTPTGATSPATVTDTTPTITWAGLIPGTTYTINETPQAGYDPAVMSCTGITDTDTNPATVTFTAPLNTLAEAPEVVCSISNPAQTSQVSVTKTVTGVDASLAWSFPFTLTPTPTGQPASQNATGTGPTTATPITWTGLIPGTTYTINEGTVPGYDQGALTCTGITDTDGNTTNASVTFTAPLNTLAEAPEVVCSISNPAQTSQVSVTKTVTGSTITPWSFDVAISPTPTGATSPATVTDTTPTITWAGLIPGTTYTINETPQAGYDPAVMSAPASPTPTPTPPPSPSPHH